jgi:hypothetical protein
MIEENQIEKSIEESKGIQKCKTRNRIERL